MGAFAKAKSFNSGEPPVQVRRAVERRNPYARLAGTSPDGRVSRDFHRKSGDGNFHRVSMRSNEYAKLAEVEDRMWYFRSLHAHVSRLLARHVGRQRPAAVLDAGCGTGGLIRRLSALPSAWSWTGLDLSPLACELARKRCRAPILEASLEAIPAEPESFDAIVSADVLYHLDNDAAALREFVRVLRPGGLVVVNVPAYAWLWSYHDEAVEGRRRYGKKELIGKMRSAGLQPLATTHWNTILFPLIALRRKFLPAPKNGGSDVAGYPAAIDAVLGGLMAIERGWIQAISPLPFGCSLLVAARKPAI